MKAFPARACLLIALGAAINPPPAGAQDSSSLSGAWMLNRSLSEMPREIGFNVAWLPGVPANGQSAETSGGRGRRSGGGGAAGSGIPNSIPRESSEDARRLQFVTSEARNPPTRLTIVDAPGAVTITNELGQSRVLHPTGRDEAIDIQGVPFIVTTKRDGSQLVTVYRVEEGRTVRYTYSRSGDPSQLVVEVQFIEKGSVEKARRVYEPATQTDTLSSPGASQQRSAPLTAPATTTATGQKAEPFDERPGAELKGLTALGILVEDLGSQAVACGLNHDTLENTLTKRLADAGLTVKKNSDEDTYVYVNVMTSSLPNGTCVSRYDAFLYTHATAKLSYGSQPVLVQISLIHRGSIGSSSAPGVHAAAVTRGLEGYMDLFITQIRAANRSDRDQR